MKKIFKSRIFWIIITAIVCTTTAVGATVLYNSSEIGFTPTDPNWHVNNLEDAINDLHNTSNKTAVQVATLTTQGASYTMQNDGYVVGTARGGSGYAAMIFFSDDIVHVAENNYTRTASIYAPKDTVVNTRANYGTYNLTVYEWR